MNVAFLRIAPISWFLSFGCLVAQPLSGETNDHDDPFSLILQRAIESLDESYDSWNFRPEETVDSTTFTINYTASLSTDGRRRLDRVMILHADPNRDRIVTRDEAHRFLEIQLGMRWVTDDLLHLEDGRVVDFAGFLRADTNQDDIVSEQEFVVAVWDSEGANSDFHALDTNGDGGMTLAEYAAPDGPNVRDMVSWFRQADRNGDQLLNEVELVESSPIHRQRLIRSNLSGFDEDGDQQLSLTEFRVSMLGNVNYPWETLPRDEDHDDAISFDEFQFHRRDLFQLQKRLYFHRLDRNGDDQLTLDEFEFSRQKSYSLYRISAGGEEVTQIYHNDRYPVLGAPAISADGNRVMCHATPPQGEHRSLIVLMSADGGETREVCDGLMPSWSPSGSRFACSRYEGGAGVWIMRTDGGVDRRIDDGWGAQWSPDGNSIAYTNDNGIRIYDLETGQSRVVLSKHDHPYRYLHPNMCWSPDSRQIAFLANLDRYREIGVLTLADKSDLNRRFRTVDETGTDLSWSRDGKRLLLSMFSQRFGRSLIYQMGVHSGEPPVILADSGTATSWEDICVSPTGEYMVATSAR